MGTRVPSQRPQPAARHRLAAGLVLLALLGRGDSEARARHAEHVELPAGATALWVGGGRVGVGTPGTGVEKHVNVSGPGLPRPLLEAMLERASPADAQWGIPDVAVFASSTLPATALDPAFLAARVLTAPRVLLVLDPPSTTGIPFVLPALDRETSVPRCLVDDGGSWTELGRPASLPEHLEAADLRVRPAPGATVGAWVQRIEAERLQEAGRLTLASEVLDGAICDPGSAVHPDRIDAARWTARARAHVDDDPRHACAVELRHAAQAYAS